MRDVVPLALLLTSLIGCDGGAPKGNPEGVHPVKQTVDPDDPDACAQCHAQIVSEWKESMHARSHHAKDPIYGGVHGLVAKKLGADTAKACARCHNPRDPDEPTSPAGALGVSCATCHMLDDVHVGTGKSGADALVFASEVRMRAGHDMAPGSSPAHQTGPAPEFIKDRETLCLACHDAATNPGGVTTCATGAEFEGRAAKEKGCIDCHMPRIEGPGGEVGSRSEHARHVFLGPHRAWYEQDSSFLAEAVSLETTFAEAGLQVTITNRSGHGFPTGFPGRTAVLMVIGKDAAGEVVWRNIENDPMKESPDSVFNKVYVDEEGKPTMPVFSASMKRDNRLKPAEVRTLTFEVPESVATVDSKLFLHLVPKAAHEKIGIAGELEAEPRLVTTAVATR